MGTFPGISQLLWDWFIACKMLYYNITLSAAADYGKFLMNCNGMYLYSRVGPVILSPAESAMPWVYCYLPMMLN